MKKTYVLVPLIGVLIFIGIHLKFQAGFEEEEAAKKAVREKARQEKMQADVEARRKAADDAVALQEKRKKEKALKEAQETAQKDARLAMLDAKEKAYRDRDKLSKQVDRLKADILVEKDAIAKVEKTKQASSEEEAFLRNFVKQAETNKGALEEVLNKIKSADDALAAAAAAKAAEDAKKKSSS
jgi:colicin import membrane protein